MFSVNVKLFSFIDFEYLGIIMTLLTKDVELMVITMMLCEKLFMGATSSNYNEFVLYVDSLILHITVIFSLIQRSMLPTLLEPYDLSDCMSLNGIN